MEYVSYSRLAMYDECPYRFYVNYILKQKDPTSLPAVLGNVVHKAAELKLKTASNQRNREYVEVAISLLRNEWKDDHVAVAFLDQISIPEAIYLLNNLPVEKVQNGEVEKRIQVPIDSSNPFMPELLVIIDYLDYTSKLFSDWKTGRTKAKEMQINVYGLALTLNGIDVDNGNLVYLRDNETDKKQITVQSNEEAKQWIIQTYEKIEKGTDRLMFDEHPEIAFPATSNANCQYCASNLKCPLLRIPEKDEDVELLNEVCTQIGIPEGSIGRVKLVQENPDHTHRISVDIDGATHDLTIMDFNRMVDVSAIAEIHNIDDATQAFRELIRLEGVVKSVKSSLKEFMKDNPTVEELSVGTKRFAEITSESASFKDGNSVAAFMRELVESGINPYDIVTVSSESLKKLKKQDDTWDGQRLENYLKFTKRSQFRVVATK